VPDLVPPEFSSEALVRALGDAPETSTRVLVVQPASGDVAARLGTRGWRADAVAAYRTVVDHSSVDAGRRALGNGVDAVLFTSGSTVRSFVELWGHPAASAVVCCMGPRTAEACTQAGIRVDAVAAEQTIDGLV